MRPEYSFQLLLVIQCSFVINCTTIEIYKFESEDTKLEGKHNIPFDYRYSYENLVGNVSKTCGTHTNYSTESFTRPYMGKKWQVGRVSRKQYEIVNMLWRKTNIFNDEDVTSPKYADKTPDTMLNYVTTTSPEIKGSQGQQTSTMSFIEFYYLDENLDSNSATRAVHKEITNNKYTRDFKTSMLRSPLFAFHLNKPAYKKTSIDFQPEKVYDKIHSPIIKTPKFQVRNVKFQNNMPKANVSSSLEVWPNLRNSNFLQTFMQSNTSTVNYVHSLSTVGGSNNKSENSSENLNTLPNNDHSTTANDKIRFFEIYDSETRVSKTVTKPDTREVRVNNTTKDAENPFSKMLREREREMLQQVDRDFGHGPSKVRYAKKDVKKSLRDYDQGQMNTALFDKASVISTKLMNIESQQILSMEEHKSDTSVKTNDFTKNISSNAVPWSDYPFAAVYVYERFQVHCDAAAISPHFLVASASCLSRYRENTPECDRSAFVTYCGENWWNPERITYVKYTVLHPRYHPKDVIRRHQYNIGVIQVVTSMSSSCSKWKPVAIMSYQYLTDAAGSPASAVGWGLDRYDRSYTSIDLPRKPLSLYEGFVFYNNCRGNVGYSNMKRDSKESVSNVYCLSLPPYSGEKKDPIHGGLLLVGGKLIALYLQEERRLLGEQAALYTGIWRLVPWVLETAYEPEEIDYFI